MDFPKTSRRMLAAMGADFASPRWEQFFATYEPGLRSYAVRHFPGLDADDLVQDTFLDFVRHLPGYVYDPGAKGAFHAYLIGMLRLCARARLREAAREARRATRAEGALHPPACETTDPEIECMREAVYEIALRQFLSDPRVHGQTKKIFRRVAIAGEDPMEVARTFGISRNAVDQIKNRSVRRLRDLVAQLMGDKDGTDRDGHGD